MPTLGFLKKKRTREGNTDPSASNSNPTSPVTPTSASKFHESLPAPRPLTGAGTGTGTSTGTGQAGAAVPPSATSVPQNHGDGSSNHGSSNTHTHGNNNQPQQQQQPMNSAANLNAPLQSNPSQYHQPQPQSQSQSYTTAAHPVHATTTAPNPTPVPAGTDSQTFPSINNLINHPQHEHAAPPNDLNPNHHSNHQHSQTLAPPGQQGPLSPHGVPPPPSASPGTDPTRPQHHQQQQQGFQPPPPPPPPNNVPSASPAASTTMQQHQTQQPAGLPQQQQHHYQPGAVGHPQAQPVSQPRVTKGKYSLNDFDIQRTLGTGSFGRVHLVQSKHNQRFYAVKVLKKAQVVKMKQVEHTNDERRMLSDVKHPFLITLWGTFQDLKNLYMVMDFVEGGELFSLLRKSGRFPNPVAKFYAAEVTLALEYLHSKNIIYRDLKPENLLLDRHGHLKITDFGFAKRVPDKTWTLCGTPDYLAPEVVSNKGYNKSVDWWSLGILIYEMLCGYTPFWDGGSPMKIYENITKGVVKYPGYINPDAQNLLERLITADLTKRLGNLFGGSQDVKNHPWFAEVTWDRLARKDIDAPYTPPVKAGTGDASQFDRYPEESDKYGVQGGTDEFGHLFTEF
ncbi:hypothetical protein S40285_01205 [Stachybotrys chlorohalonatus IBT 40285]|uniref:cAMP-dependent protein kinase n=1 Tax=Stachybotrys chlorohalonatus (strain IBT 40285) TaxID=1283841 RepID=A0A084QY27_STAC4|nr:hypothetical protein S40285_01205 [Stachybotrys chlorohalonata IBT 40285]